MAGSGKGCFNHSSDRAGQAPRFPCSSRREGFSASGNPTTPIIMAGLHRLPPSRLIFKNERSRVAKTALFGEQRSRCDFFYYDAFAVLNGRFPDPVTRHFTRSGLQSLRTTSLLENLKECMPGFETDPLHVAWALPEWRKMSMSLFFRSWRKREQCLPKRPPNTSKR